MSFRAYRILIPVLVIVLVALAVLILLMDSSFHAAQVAGYPGEGEGATATSGPYPGPNTRGPINPPVEVAYNSPTPLNATAHYLPVGGRMIPFQFSAGLANHDEVDALVPDDMVSIDGYVWGYAPNTLERTVHMPRRCIANYHERYMCWIVNDWVLNYDDGTIIRSNLAGISTPLNHNPVASSSSPPGNVFAAQWATDGAISEGNPFVGGQWASSETDTATFTIPNLQPADLHEIVIDWWRDSAHNITGTYATAYSIEAFFKKTGQQNEDWHTIYSTSSGSDSSKHVIDTFTGYNSELVSAVRLNMTERGETTNDSYKYAIDELEIYGRVEDQLFLRKKDPNEAPSLSDERWWEIWLSNHPGHIWLIGNEPDNFDLDAGDGMRPEDYANFYARAAIFLREADPSAQIIFCQGTYAESPITTPSPSPTPGSPTPGTPVPQAPHGYGPQYCGAALEFLRNDILPSTNYSLEDLIDGFAIHQYIEPKIDNKATAEAVVATWEAKLNHFSDWVNDLSEDGLDGRPLYLTEYGDLNNACAPLPEPGATPVPNLPYGCGTQEEYYAWFGGIDQGFWAIQYYTTDFLLDMCSGPNQTDCNAQWLASWWYWAGRGPDKAYEGGMFNNNNLLENPNAFHYHNAIDCHLNGNSCTPTPTYTPTPTPTPTATESSGGVGG